MITGARAIVLLMLFAGPAVARDPWMPDPRLTPGVATLLTTEQICARKWGKDARKVTPAMKRSVFKMYGLSGNDDPSCKADEHGRHFEIDHLESRELGGADDIANLWPQCYSGPWNATMKDRVENRLHKELCAGNITLDDAQQSIRLDWTIPYKLYFGDPEK